MKDVKSKFAVKLLSYKHCIECRKKLLSEGVEVGVIYRNAVGKYIIVSSNEVIIRNEKFVKDRKIKAVIYPKGYIHVDESKKRKRKNQPSLNEFPKLKAKVKDYKGAIKLFGSTLRPLEASRSKKFQKILQGVESIL